jgi:hypothetical protein
LFRQWADYPPTNILLKALLEGLGGTKSKVEVEEQEATLGPNDPAFGEMQRAAAAAISMKAGRALPIMRGRDPGLPAAAPVFDESEMRKRNAEILRRKGR